MIHMQSNLLVCPPAKGAERLAGSVVLKHVLLNMESFWGRMLLRIAEKEMKLVSHEKYGVKIIWVLYLIYIERNRVFNKGWFMFMF